MSVRPGPSQEGFPSSPPSLEAHSNEHFNLAKRYYDTESDHVEYVNRREYRETYNSDASNPAVNDYDNNGNYEYRQYYFNLFYFTFFVFLKSSLQQKLMILILIPMYMDNVESHHKSPYRHRAVQDTRIRLPPLTRIIRSETLTQHGAVNVRYPFPKKKSRTSSSILLTSSVFKGIR